MRGVRVNIKKLAGAVAATAITFSVGAATAAPASAVDNVKPFGSQERLNDRVTGAPMIGYTVRDLSPSSDLRGTRLVVQSLCGLGLVGRGPL